MERCHLRGIPAQGQPQRLSHGLAGQVVLGRSQAAHQHQNVNPAQRNADGIDEVLAAITHNRLERYGDAYPVQLLGQVKRVRILTIRR